MIEKRRNGYRVIYLGQNVPLDSLVSMVRTLRPAVVCCSATRRGSAKRSAGSRAMTISSRSSRTRSAGNSI